MEDHATIAMLRSSGKWTAIQAAGGLPALHNVLYAEPKRDLSGVCVASLRGRLSYLENEMLLIWKTMEFWSDRASLVKSLEFSVFFQ